MTSKKIEALRQFLSQREIPLKEAEDFMRKTAPLMLDVIEAADYYLKSLGRMHRPHEQHNLAKALKALEESV